MNSTELIALAKEIVVWMPETWVVKPFTNDVAGVKLVRVGGEYDGATVDLMGSEWHRQQGRIVIDGDWPSFDGVKSMPYNNCPKITVSESGGASRIAREIVKRFLPEYLPLYLKHRDVVKAEESAKQKREEAAEALRLPSLKDLRITKGHGSVEVSCYEPYIVAQSHNGETWNVKLDSLPLAVLVKIVELASAAAPEPKEVTL